MISAITGLSEGSNMTTRRFAVRVTVRITTRSRVRREGWPVRANYHRDASIYQHRLWIALPTRRSALRVTNRITTAWKEMLDESDFVCLLL